MPHHPAAPRLAAAVLLLACSLPVRADDNTPPQLLFPPGQMRVDIPLIRLDHLLALPVKINDSAPNYFVLDTGSSMTVVNPEFAKELKLDVHGNSDAGVIGDSGASIGVAPAAGVSVGGVKLSNIFITVMDLKKTSLPKSIRGILGNDWLARTPFTIDFANARLTLFAPAHFTPPPTPPIELQIFNHVFTTPVSIEGDPFGWFIIDSGSDGKLHLEHHVGMLHRDLCFGPHWVRSFAWGAGGIERNTVSTAKRVQALGNSWEDVEVDCRSRKSEPMTDATAGILGAQLMADSQLTIDAAHLHAWLVKSPREKPLEPAADQAGMEKLEGETTPLMLAARADQLEEISSLLKKGAAIDAVDFRGYTALMYAIRAGSPRAAGSLVDAGTDVNHAADHGLTPLTLAARFGQKEIVELLLKHHAGVNAADLFGATPLIHAAEAGRLDIVELLLQNKADVNILSPAFGTAVAVAACHGYDAIVQRLADAGADLNAMDLDHKQSPPIFTAIDGGHPQTVRLLIKLGVRLTATQKTQEGRLEETALFFAVANSELECVKALLEAGMDPRKPTGNLPSALDEAYNHADAEITRLLYFYKPPPPPATAPATQPAEK